MLGYLLWAFPEPVLLPNKEKPMESVDNLF